MFFKKIFNSKSSENESAKNNENSKFFSHTIISIGSAFIVVFAAMNLLGISSVSGQSMEPTFHDGDIVMLNTLRKNYQKGDCIIFTKEADNDRCIKRIAATAGDLVDCNSVTGEMFVNGTSLFVPEFPVDPADEVDFPITVPEGYVFVLGDNYNHSRDSRYNSIGLVSENEIDGKVIVRFSKDKFVEIVKNTTLSET